MNEEELNNLLNAIRELNEEFEYCNYTESLINESIKFFDSDKNNRDEVKQGKRITLEFYNTEIIDDFLEKFGLPRDLKIIKE